MADEQKMESEVKTVKVNVNLAGKVYCFHVSTEEEELLRKACAMLNARMNELSRFEFKESVDHLATAALQCMVWFLREKKRDVSGTLIREIQFLDRQLDDYLDRNVGDDS